MTITPKDQFDKSIPQPNDFLAVSQSDFLSNFGQLYNAFLKNHIALDAVSSSGNHTNIELLKQTQGPETSVGENSLYCKELVQINQTTNQLYFRYQGGRAAGTEVQLTNYQIYTQPVIQPGQFGFFTYLPGGLILYFGGVNFSATNGRTLYLNPFICTNIMAFNFCAAGTIPTISPDVSFIIERPPIITTLQARINSFSPGIVYYYIVLGNTT